jgi:predicted phosphodiesterase
MKLHLLSDLHMESGLFEPPSNASADVVVLPGDLHHGWEGLEWVKKHFSHRPILIVLGNHDYFGEQFPDLCEELQEATRGTNIHILENNEIVLDGVTFLGASLWTDFAFDGDASEGAARSGRLMPDYQDNIRFGPEARPLEPADTLARHRQSVAWLRERFTARQQNASGKLVVITHHAPSAQAVAGRPDKPEYNAALASRLDDLVLASGAALWIHGHVHQRLDYRVGETRLVCNPRGDVSRRAVQDFDPGLVIEV